MKKVVALVFIGLVIAGASAFAQSEDIRVLERSNDFSEIRGAFQKRLYDASSNFKYFFYQTEPFDIIVTQGELLKEIDRKTKKAIEKNKYFNFEAFFKGIVYHLVLVKKEDSTAIRFVFYNYNPSWFEAARSCSRDEIDEALYFSFGAE